MVHNVVSLSGGKDSTALALLAIERWATPGLRFVFADTGHEHPATLGYVAYLDEEFRRRVGRGVDVVSADFSARIKNKREFVREKWPERLTRDRPGKWVPRVMFDAAEEDRPPAPPAPQDPFTEMETKWWLWEPQVRGVSSEVAQQIIARALQVLHPTGIPFLDLCLWKGRFPSTRRRFCTEQLKQAPISEYMASLRGTVVSWQGVRAAESQARSRLPTVEHDPMGWMIYRPLLSWSADEVFEQHRRHGVRWNPLYEQGMGRVGCMPCIHAGKREVREIAKRHPDQFERVAEWERLVAMASRTGSATLMDARVTARFLGTAKDTATVKPETHGIGAYAQWAMTSRGGRQFDLVHEAEAAEVPACSSIYGLCE